MDLCFYVPYLRGASYMHEYDTAGCYHKYSFIPRLPVDGDPQYTQPFTADVSDFTTFWVVTNKSICVSPLKSAGTILVNTTSGTVFSRTRSSNLNSDDVLSEVAENSLMVLPEIK